MSSRSIFWARLLMRVRDPVNSYFAFRKLKCGNGTYLCHSQIQKKISFMFLLSTFFLSPPLPSHPYSCHLTSSAPTLTHYFKNQASNSILSFSPALGYISYLTKMFLYHDQLYFSLKWIMNRSPSLFFLCSSPVIA